MSFRLLATLGLLAGGALAAPENAQKSSCAACDPQGIKTLNTPAYGPDLGPMYSDLVNTVQGIHFLLDLDKRSGWAENRIARRNPPPLCCELIVMFSLTERAVG